MTTVHHSDHIDAPQHEVFEVCSDFAHAAERIEDIQHIEVLTPGPIGVGTRFRETRRMFGKDASEEMTVRVFDPPNRYVVTAASHGSEFTTTFRFTPEGSGTRVDVEFQSKPISFGAKLMSPLMFLMSGMLRKCLAKDVSDLKRFLESKSSVA